MRLIAPLTWPNPNQENAEIATTARDREVIMRIGRVAFTV